MSDAIAPRMSPPFRRGDGSDTSAPTAAWPVTRRTAGGQRGEFAAHRAPTGDDGPVRRLRSVPPPPEMHDAEPEPVPAFDPVQQVAAADLRSQVVLRMRKMTALHAQHAWDQRYRDPLSPYGVAFFFYEPDQVLGGQLRYVLRTGTRLFLDADAPPELPRLLYELARQAFDWRQQGLDPYPLMTDRRDEMSPDARYLGVGVSSLDSRWATWAETQRSAQGVTDVPGRGIAYLSDGTSFVCDRGASGQFDEFRVRSTHSLHHGTVRWQLAATADGLVDADDLRGRQMINEVLRRISDLHRAMVGGVR